MKHAILALVVLMLGCPSNDDVATETADAGAIGEDAAVGADGSDDSGTYVPDASAEEDAGTPPEFGPMLERPCTQGNEFTVCPTGTGQPYTALCSPQQFCSFLCDRCVAPSSVPSEQRDRWEAECEAGRHTDQGTMEMVPDRMADCAALGGTCQAMARESGYGSGDRSWCAL